MKPDQRDYSEFIEKFPKIVDNIHKLAPKLAALFFEEALIFARIYFESRKKEPTLEELNDLVRAEMSFLTKLIMEGKLILKETDGEG